MTNRKYKQIGTIDRSIDSAPLRRYLENVSGNLENLSERIARIESPDTPKWRDLTLQNGWDAIDSINKDIPEFHRNSQGIVYIRGIITGGTITSPTVIATVPVGFRPAKITAWSIAESGGSGAGRIFVSPNGDVSISEITNNSNISINGYYFAED